MIEVFVAGIGLCGTGLPDWPSAIPVLAGERPLGDDAPRLPPPPMLAPNERRRAGAVVRLALAVAQEASAAAGLEPGAARGVFASSNGDGAVVVAIVEALSDPGALVSPTQFHNSVHNAAAGYWSIGAGSTQATSSLGCHDATFAAALLKAAAEAQAERQTVLLCVYDAPFPEPLASCRPTAGAFGAALVLTPDRPAAPLARLRLDWCAEPAPGGGSVPGLPGLHALHQDNPAARILPLLEAIARRVPTSLSFALLDGRVNARVEPCSTAPASAR